MLTFIRLEPKFFSNCKHIFIKRTNAYFTSAISFAHIKSSCNMNSIKASAFRQYIIIAGYGIFKSFIDVPITMN